MVLKKFKPTEKAKQLWYPNITKNKEKINTNSWYNQFEILNNNPDEIDFEIEEIDKKKTVIRAK